MQQKHKSIAKGSVISVKVSGDATIYVAVEGGSGRDGGIPASLPAAGWKSETTMSLKTTGGLNLNKLYSLQVAGGTAVALPVCFVREHTVNHAKHTSATL